MRQGSGVGPRGIRNFIGPDSAFGKVARGAAPAANTNRPEGREAFPFGYNPKAVAEAELFAVEAMYLGADILETLKRVNREISREKKAETARLARTLLYWGVGATSGGVGAT